MYNRYIPNSNGTFTRKQVRDEPPPRHNGFGGTFEERGEHHAEPPPRPNHGKRNEDGFFGLSGISNIFGSLGEKFKSLDMGDIVLLAVLFLLFLESEDEEFLIILALVLLLD